MVVNSLVFMTKPSSLGPPGRPSLRDITDRESQSPKRAKCEVRPLDSVRFDTIDHLSVHNAKRSQRDASYWDEQEGHISNARNAASINASVKTKTVFQLSI